MPEASGNTFAPRRGLTQPGSSPLFTWIGVIMKIIRHALVFGGLIFCLLFMTLDTAYAQQVPPRGYLFLEVKDIDGKKVSNAAVTVSGVDGKEIHSVHTNEEGIVKAEFWFWRLSEHHYGLQISKSGFLPY